TLESVVKLCERDSVAEPGECATLSDLLRSLQKAAPRRTGQGSAHADSPNPRIGKLSDRGEIGADQNVHRLWRDRLDDRTDIVQRAETRCVEAVRASF